MHTEPRSTDMMSVILSAPRLLAVAMKTVQMAPIRPASLLDVAVVFSQGIVWIKVAN
jgi:hypothetical protein